MSDWVKLGIALHKGKREKCAFCGNTISKYRIEDLENHFSEAVKKLDTDIDELIHSWETVKCVNEIAEDSSIFYDELGIEISECSSLYKKESKNIMMKLNNTLNCLK